jgi:hypothetical protein
MAIVASDYDNKVNAYFQATYGREATAAELSTWTNNLLDNQGSVWTGDFQQTLSADKGWGSDPLSQADAETQVDEILANLFDSTTGLDASIATYYVDHLVAGTIKPRGVVNAILNDLGLMPNVAGELSKPAGWGFGPGDGLLTEAQIDTYKENIDFNPEPTPGETFVLTTDTDNVFTGTAESDLFDGSTLNSLQTGDILLDNTTTDEDVLNATITSTTAEPRVQNIETVNLTGEYVSVGFDLGLSMGINNLNLDTKIAGGTASVSDANSLNAAAINAGDNIKTLNVTSLSSGTRDTVAIDAANASAVNVTGSTGPDTYAVELAEEATLTLATMTSAGDVLTANVAGDATIDAGVAADNAELDLNIDATTADAEITLSDAGFINAEQMELSGSKDITLIVTDGKALSDTAGAGAAANYDGTAITSSTTGVSTIQGSALATASANFSSAVVDVVDIAGTAAAATTVTVNSASKVLLSGDAGGALTLELNNADKNTTFDKGTLIVDIAEAQTNALITSDRATQGADGTVETLLVRSAADQVTDLDQDENGYKETTMTLTAGVTLGDTTTALVIDGEENLNIGAVINNAADQVITASNMTGNLTISSISDDSTIIGGKGNDRITTSNAKIVDVQSGEGVDTINVATSADNSEVDAGAGNDSIISSSNITKINAGAGDDTITAAGKDTITLGAGSDTLKLADNLATATASVVVKDFVKGTDTIVLSGVQAAGNVDLTAVDDVTNGVYLIGGAASGAGVWEVTLENGGSKLTETDLSDSIQLNIIAANASTVTAGSKDDSVAINAGETATITTGAGSDDVTIAAGASSGAVVKDFVVETDKIVATGAITNDLSVNLNNVTATSGTYTLGDAASGASFKLENGGSDIVTENNLTNIVQLGSGNFTAGVGFTGLFGVDTTTAAVSVTGGKFNDFVELADTGTSGTVFNFSNNGGVDTVVTAAFDGSTGTVNFNSMTGIDSTQGKVYKAADAAKTSDATDGAVYVFDSSKDGAGSSKITTFQTHNVNGYTQDVIDDEVAAFIDTNLGVDDGESYIVIINDDSTSVYQGKAYGGADAGQYNYESYAYLVTGDSDGVQADDIQLIGAIDDGNDTLDNLTFASQANVTALIG